MAKRQTKKQVIDEFFTLYDEMWKIYQDKVKNLLNEGKITTGHCYYILSPQKNYGVRCFFGDAEVTQKKGAMFSNPQKYTLWDFNYALKDLKKLQEEYKELFVQFKCA